MRETSSGPSLSVDMLRDDQAKDGGRADPQGKQLEQSYVEQHCEMVGKEIWS
jgi:hypothetical protein